MRPGVHLLPGRCLRRARSTMTSHDATRKQLPRQVRDQPYTTSEIVIKKTADLPSDRMRMLIAFAGLSGPAPLKRELRPNASLTTDAGRNARPQSSRHRRWGAPRTPAPAGHGARLLRKTGSTRHYSRNYSHCVLGYTLFTSQPETPWGI